MTSLRSCGYNLLNHPGACNRSRDVIIKFGFERLSQLAMR